MSAISKHWSELTAGVDCATLSHPGKTCHSHILFQLRTTVWGNMQFFIPVSILRLFLLIYTQKSVSWHIVRQTLFEFSCMVANGWVVSNSWSACFCAFYHWFGRIINNYSVSMAALPGTLVMFWMPQYVQMSHARAVFNVFVECWIKSRNHPWMEYARESKTIGTVVFMLISATIGYYAQRTKAVEFWFFAPLKKNSNDHSKTPCFHRNTCQSYILDGMKTCFTFGMILELARKLIASAPRIRRHPPALLGAISRIRFKFVAFLTLYNGLFRFVTCFLAQHRRKVSSYDSTVAGLISGLSYSLSPNFNVFSLAMTAMIQNIWNYISEQYGGLDLVKRFNRLSFTSIAWVLLMNYNMYSRAYYPYAMSKYALKFTDVCSNSQARTASECLAKLFLAAN
ncbi:uncharacterized protein LOC131678705 [Topomyia yanbarensis]|uniref:uncharacterized protein LOC131678705 n=1 Tax=Topomyia yanbarensis TaxID=2498891 RepID=UPI00273BCEA5|nr:uncharacterized protein LOC131678705 [Topomyia yanbarensis]